MFRIDASEGFTGALCSTKPWLAMMSDVPKKIIINRILQDNFSTVVDFFLQPIFNLSTFQCVGVEVLLRGIYRQHIVSPGYILPRVRETEGIIHVGEHIILHAFEFLRNEIIPCKPDLFMTINMATHQLNAEACAEHISQMQQRYSIPASSVIFEITASKEMLNATGEQNIERLRAAGFGVAWDDIATTKNVIEKMSRVGSDYIKLDRDCLKLQNARETKEVISLAHSYQATVIAEGVETMAQTSLLLKQNVELAQGFLFSRPVRKNDFKNSFLLC